MTLGERFNPEVRQSAFQPQFCSSELWPVCPEVEPKAQSLRGVPSGFASCELVFQECECFIKLYDYNDNMTAIRTELRIDPDRECQYIGFEEFDEEIKNLYKEAYYSEYVCDSIY